MTDRRRVKMLVKIWVSLGVIILVLGYGGWKAKSLAEGPRLEITSPTDGQSFREALVSIRGTASNISFLTLNGDKIFTDESGAYSENILLASGYNRVTVEAVDRFGRKVTRTLQLILK